MNPLVSIILPTVNAPTLYRVLDSLFWRTPPGCELVLVCDTPDVLRWNCFVNLNLGSFAKHLPITLLVNCERVGTGRALNQGVALARGDYLALTGDDYVVHPGWLEPLIMALQEEPTYGMAVSSKDRPGQFPGAMMLTRACWERVGAFDEAFYSLGNDADYYLRCQEMGYCPVGVRESMVDDIRGGTIAQDMSDDQDDPVRALARNRLSVKHGPGTPWAKVHYMPRSVKVAR